MPPRPDKKQPISFLQRTKITLDWKAYFLEYCKVHGEPVLYKDMLLFPDGFRYSSTDYQGPEFPPPTDNYELDNLILTYYRERKTQLTLLMNRLQHTVKQLTDVQSRRSVKLQQVTHKLDHENKRQVTSKPLDLSSLKQQIMWVRDDLEVCVIRIAEILEYHKEKDK